LYTCGIQDHAAAAYGGASAWLWRFERPGQPFRRRALLTGEALAELSSATLVAHSGSSHDSAGTVGACVDRFLAGLDRRDWKASNAATHRFAQAVARRHWNEAAEWLAREMEIHRRIRPESLTEASARFVDLALDHGCGARYAGAGNGGCVWAIGLPDRIVRLRGAWRLLAEGIPGAGLLDCTITERGVVLHE
jgi:D-glycero-alpha-D-manno-heptose-7-phosphate kinase